MIRQRHNNNISNNSQTNSNPITEEEKQDNHVDKETTKLDAIDNNVKIRKNNDYTNHSTKKNSFYIAKCLILGLLGLVYFMAFLGAYNQNKGLVSMNGLIPCTPHMNELLLSSNNNNTIIGRIQLFIKYPSILWLLPIERIEDYHIDVIIIMGLVLSFILMMGVNRRSSSSTSSIILLLLWMLDFSIVTYADNTTNFYSYGWESQLLETGFLAIFLTDITMILPPSFCNRRNEEHHQNQNHHPSMVSLWLMRWLCFRISIGAGLIKMRGGSCWKNKTCLYYHFETQPLPSPFSFIFHFLPKTMLYHAVNLDLFVQLYSVWMVLVPGVNTLGRYIRNIGGCMQVLFMINIMLSGNYAFLNHVTIIPALACIDDSCYPIFLQRLFYNNHNHNTSITNNIGIRRFIRYSIDIILLLLISYLSLPVISNLLQLEGKHQVMNTSFNTFRLVNTYGAFGSVGQARYEPILSLSSDGIKWTEIEFPCKPGKVTRRPCLCAPYHYRLDWNIWFIGFEPHGAYLQRREQWVYALIIKLLSTPSANNSTNNYQSQLPWLDLIDKPSALHYIKQQQSTLTSFKYAKVDMHHYTMSQSLLDILWQCYYNCIDIIFSSSTHNNKNNEVIWWNRLFKENLIPPVSYDKRSEKLHLVDNN